jgi:ribosomal silencing factor RsfS
MLLYASQINLNIKCVFAGGDHGVFDVKQLVDLLESDGALNTFVVKLPEELRYAEHLVIVTGRSGRHRHALAQLVRRIYKKKRLSTDQIPRIEGDHVNGTNLDWIAMDLGMYYNVN